MSVTIAPIRVSCCVILLLLMWLFARIGLLGINDETLKTVPHTGWRKSIQNMLYGIGKAVVFCVGFHNVKIIGEQVRKQKFHFRMILLIITQNRLKLIYVFIKNGFSAHMKKQQS